MGALRVVCTVPDFCHRKKGLSGEESMVLGHIQVAANQGDCPLVLASDNAA
jgi:hypothetical protein